MLLFILCYTLLHIFGDGTIAVAPTPKCTGEHVPSHWLGTGGNVSRRTENKKLAKLY